MHYGMPCGMRTIWGSITRQGSNTGKPWLYKYAINVHNAWGLKPWARCTQAAGTVAGASRVHLMGSTAHLELPKPLCLPWVPTAPSAQQGAWAVASRPGLAPARHTAAEAEARMGTQRAAQPAHFLVRFQYSVHAKLRNSLGAAPLNPARGLGLPASHTRAARSSHSDLSWAP